MSSPSHHVPTRAARQDPDAPLRVDLRIPFAACAVEGFLLLGLYTLLTYLKLPRLTLLGLVFLGVYALSVGVTFTAFAWRLSRSRRNIRTAELLTADIYRMFRSVMDIPYAVINGDNRVRVINAAMQSILGARSPVCDLPLSEICPAVTREQLLAALRNPGDGELPDLHSVPLPAGAEDGTGSVTVTLADGRRYRVEPYLLRQQADTYYLLLFRDVNDYLNFVEETDRNRVVLAYIVLDNLQELTQFVRANYRATANIIEETLTGWVASMHGMIREYDRDKYLALFSEEMLDLVRAGQFLDSRKNYEYPRGGQHLPAVGIHGNRRHRRQHGGARPRSQRRPGHGAPARRQPGRAPAPGRHRADLLRRHAQDAGGQYLHLLPRVRPPAGAAACRMPERAGHGTQQPGL